MPAAGVRVDRDRLVHPGAARILAAEVGGVVELAHHVLRPHAHRHGVAHEVDRGLGLGHDPHGGGVDLFGALDEGDLVLEAVLGLGIGDPVEGKGDVVGIKRLAVMPFDVAAQLELDGGVVDALPGLGQERREAGLVGAVIDQRVEHRLADEIGFRLRVVIHVDRAERIVEPDPHGVLRFLRQSGRGEQERQRRGGEDDRAGSTHVWPS
jgi:hypothetical protein